MLSFFTDRQCGTRASPKVTVLKETARSLYNPFLPTPPPPGFSVSLQTSLLIGVAQ